MSTGTELTTTPVHKALSGMGGGGIPSLIPQTIDEVWRFSQLLANSGLTPKGIETPEQVTVQILMGFDLGLKPMQAVQNIAVINGKPSIGGDLALAVLMTSGQLVDHDEWIEGEGDQRVGVCRVERKGMKPIERRFSVADAIRAGLWQSDPLVRKSWWNKNLKKREYGAEQVPNDSPWFRYQDRMLCMRARGFAFRDRFSDVLKGMHLTEEMVGHEEDLPQQQVSEPGPAAPPPAAAVSGPTAPPPERQVGEVKNVKPIEATEVDRRVSDKPAEEAELVEEAPGPEPERAAAPAEQQQEEQHPQYAQEEPFDVEAWLEEVRGHFASAKTISDVDDVHATFEDTATDLPAIEAQRYEDMHGAAIKRIEDALKAEIERDVLGKVAPRYFIHPESGSYWHTTDGSDPRSEGASDGAIEEVNRDQFEAFKTTMDARGALAPSDQSEAQDDDVELESDDDEQGVAEQPTVADLYVTKIRAMIADPETPFPVIGRYWNDTKAERAEMLSLGLMSKETRNELLDELDQRKKGQTAGAPQDGGPSAPPPPSSGPIAPPPPANDATDEEPIVKLDREFRAALEACADKVQVAALAAESLVARNKFSGTPQHKAWSDLVAAKRKSFAGVTA